MDWDYLWFGSTIASTKLYIRYIYSFLISMGSVQLCFKLSHGFSYGHLDNIKKVN